MYCKNFSEEYIFETASNIFHCTIHGHCLGDKCPEWGKADQIEEEIAEAEKLNKRLSGITLNGQPLADALMDKVC